jgi:hypothetical protein
LSESQYSDEQSKNMVWLSGLLPYSKVVETYARVGGRQIAQSNVWRETQLQGERLKAEVERQRRAMRPEQVVLGDARQDHRQPKAVSLDGGMMNIRGEGWKEFKAGTVSDILQRKVLDPHTGEDIEQPHAVNTHYVAVLGDVGQFTPAFWAPAVKYRVPNALYSAVIADGAAWEWNVADDYFPDSTQIVDWYHADEHLALAAQTLHPNDDTAAKQWRHQMHEPLFAGQVWQIIRNLHRAGLPSHAHYFETHQRRMQYREFRELGFPIGSGTVESGIKQYKSRLTGSGMRWSRTHAERMLVIRSAILSDADDFDSLWAAA